LTLTFKAYFSSPKETADTLKVGPLAAGSYYLVFNNSFSLLANKVVENSIQMQAWMPL